LVVHLALDEGDFVMRVAPPQPGRQIARVSIEPGVPERAEVTIRGSAGVAVWVRQGVLSFDDACAQELLGVDGDPRAVDAALALFGFR
jgi:hypothetical protein